MKNSDLKNYKNENDDILKKISNEIYNILFVYNEEIENKTKELHVKKRSYINKVEKSKNNVQLSELESVLSKIDSFKAEFLYQMVDVERTILSIEDFYWKEIINNNNEKNEKYNISKEERFNIFEEKKGNSKIGEYKFIESYIEEFVEWNNKVFNKEYENDPMETKKLFIRNNFTKTLNKYFFPNLYKSYDIPFSSPFRKKSARNKNMFQYILSLNNVRNKHLKGYFLPKDKREENKSKNNNLYIFSKEKRIFELVEKQNVKVSQIKDDLKKSFEIIIILSKTSESFIINKII